MSRKESPENRAISPLKATVGAAFVASTLMAPLGQAADAGANPFSAQDLGSGYMQLAEGACGEGACGEGACGEEDKDDKDKDKDKGKDKDKDKDKDEKDREGACGG